jgi:hypothetical protein
LYWTILSGAFAGTSEVPFRNDLGSCLDRSSDSGSVRFGIGGPHRDPFALIVSGLQQKSWRKQKLTEMRFQAFQAAISAINAYAADAMDTDLQCAKKSYQGREMAVAIRPETTATMALGGHLKTGHRGSLKIRPTEIQLGRLAGPI